jgi:acyl carrier protein
MSTEGAPVSVIEAVARENLVTVLDSDLAADDIDSNLELAGEYGLTSLNKVLFLMSVCGEAGVDLGAFTEADVAGMRTLDDVITALCKHASSAA